MLRVNVIFGMCIALYVTKAPYGVQLSVFQVLNIETESVLICSYSIGM